MELKNHKSALAALATLGVTAVAAGATAFVKIREKRRQRRAEEAEREGESRLSAEQMMVYNESVSTFLRLNDRLYELRRHRKELQPLVQRLAQTGEKPAPTGMEEVDRLAADIEKFLGAQAPFINACLSAANDEPMTYADCVHAPVGGQFDAELDEEPTGADIADGAPIGFVLRLGYYFPDSTIAPHPVKSIIIAE